MSAKVSAIVTIRISSSLDRSLEREARRRGRTKSAVVREILEDALGGRSAATDPAEEARRQSLLVSKRASERETLAFMDRVKDGQGWKRGAASRSRRKALTREKQDPLIVQSDLFNPTHASITLFPITSDCVDARLFRLTLPAGRVQGSRPYRRSWSTRS